MVASRKSTRKMNSGDRGGFTIIEVVLVLAIAGLIFLMVFIALPSLQRAQRDTQRRNDLARVSNGITQYQTNNNGKLPNDGTVEAKEDGDLEEGWPCSKQNATGGGGSDRAQAAECFIRNYMNSVNAEENEFVDPDGWYYGLTIEDLGKGEEKMLTAEDFTGGDDGNGHMVYIEKHAKCDGERAVYSNNSRDYAVMYKLEGNGIYCQDNQ